MTICECGHVKGVHTGENGECSVENCICSSFEKSSGKRLEEKPEKKQKLGITERLERLKPELEKFEDELLQCSEDIEKLKDWIFEKKKTLEEIL